MAMLNNQRVCCSSSSSRSHFLLQTFFDRCSGRAGSAARSVRRHLLDRDGSNRQRAQDC